MKAAIYVRVSSDEQKNDLQLTELRDYCGRMNWESVEYAEKGSSVKVRPVVNQLIDTVFLLDGAGVRFICVTQGIDTDKNNPVSRLMLHIFGAFAEFERGIIVERVKAGMKEAKRRGKKLGRDRRVFRRDRAEKMRDEGMSLRPIAAQLKVPRSTISDHLSGRSRKG